MGCLRSVWQEEVESGREDWNWPSNDGSGWLRKFYDTTPIPSLEPVRRVLW